MTQPSQYFLLHKASAAKGIVTAEGDSLYSKSALSSKKVHVFEKFLNKFSATIFTILLLPHFTL